MCTAPTIRACSTITNQNQPSHHNTPYNVSLKKKKNNQQIMFTENKLILRRLDVYFIHKNFSHCCQQVFHINLRVKNLSNGEAPPWPPKPKRHVKKKTNQIRKSQCTFQSAFKTNKWLWCSVCECVCTCATVHTRSIRTSSTYNIVLQLFDWPVVRAHCHPQT